MRSEIFHGNVESSVVCSARNGFARLLCLVRSSWFSQEGFSKVGVDGRWGRGEGREGKAYVK